MWSFRHVKASDLILKPAPLCFPFFLNRLTTGTYSLTTNIGKLTNGKIEFHLEKRVLEISKEWSLKYCVKVSSGGFLFLLKELTSYVKTCSGYKLQLKSFFPCTLKLTDNKILTKNRFYWEHKLKRKFLAVSIDVIKCLLSWYCLPTYLYTLRIKRNGKKNIPYVVALESRTCSQ